jgi:hypothetical protein
MLTSDASNANYASTMVAEGPAMRMFDRMQQDMIEEDLGVMAHVVQAAIAAERLPPDTLELLDIQAVAPTLAVRDRLQDAQADQILVRNQAMSVETMAARHGLSPDDDLLPIDYANGSHAAILSSSCGSLAQPKERFEAILSTAARWRWATSSRCKATACRAALRRLRQSPRGSVCPSRPGGVAGDARALDQLCGRQGLGRRPGTIPSGGRRGAAAGQRYGGRWQSRHGLRCGGATFAPQRPAG